MTDAPTLSGLTNDPSPDPIPPSIPDYNLVRVIGKGSFGEVWVALDATGSPCALKVIYKGESKKGVFWKEFEGVRNYLPVSRSNLGLVIILHVGKDPEESFYYYTMELADNANSESGDDWENYDSKSLASMIGSLEKPCPLDQFGEIALNLSNGLAHLHEKGLIHRDVKPSNVIFVNGEAKLADVGLVSLRIDASTFIGTTGYIPPEGPGKPTADVYALGKTLYELLTGKNIQSFPELPTKVFAGKSEADKFAHYNMIIVESTNPDYRERPASGRELADLFSRHAKSFVKKRTLKRKMRKIGFFPLLFVMACLGFLIPSIVSYNQSQNPLTDFKFKHFRYYESTGSDLMDGKYLIKDSDGFSIECHFRQGLLDKAQAYVEGKLHSVLFFDTTKSIELAEDTMSEWVRNLSLMIRGDPFSVFPHRIELLRQFGKDKKVITEASFQDSLIRNSKSYESNGIVHVVTRGNGKLLWRDKEHFWVQEYRDGILVKSGHSINETTHSFQSNDENLQEVHEVSFPNGESIRMLTEKTEVPGNYQKSTEHKIGVKTLFLTVDQYEGDLLVRTESVALDENNLEARLVTEYVYDDFAQVPRVNKGQVQFSLLLKLPN